MEKKPKNSGQALIEAIFWVAVFYLCMIWGSAIWKEKHLDYLEFLRKFSLGIEDGS